MGKGAVFPVFLPLTSRKGEPPFFDSPAFLKGRFFLQNSRTPQALAACGVLFWGLRYVLRRVRGLPTKVADPFLAYLYYSPYPSGCVERIVKKPFFFFDRADRRKTPVKPGFFLFPLRLRPGIFPFGKGKYGRKISDLSPDFLYGWPFRQPVSPPECPWDPRASER